MSGQGSDHVVVPLLINNRPLTTSTPFDVVNPSSGESIWQASGAAPEEAIQAVTSAQSAFPGWSKTKPAIRRDVLLRTATILARRRDELGEYMKSETGAADPFVDFNLTTAIEMLTDVAGRISTITGTVPTASAEGTSAMVLREPYGVILGIAPWNAPYILGLRAALFALGAGNTVVLKGSELSPRCYWAIGDVFREAGLPDGCLNVIYHRPRDAAEVTQKLIAHPAVKKINFTGSTAVGSIVGALAGKHLKPVLMELGGKASAIVLDDADLDLAAQQCALGAFLHVSHFRLSLLLVLVSTASFIRLVANLTNCSLVKYAWVQNE
jgi:acyl-CoA reductase-like NAD-dependent aldehyde dehydrogenase